jgi:hypothetical protein
MPYTDSIVFVSGLPTQTPSALPSNFPRAIGGRHAVLTPATSGATTSQVSLSAVVSGGGASGGQVSGAQFTIDPRTQQIVSGYAIASGGTLELSVWVDGDLPVNP